MAEPPEASSGKVHEGGEVALLREQIGTLHTDMDRLKASHAQQTLENNKKSQAALREMREAYEAEKGVFAEKLRI